MIKPETARKYIAMIRARAMEPDFYYAGTQAQDWRALLEDFCRLLEKGLKNADAPLQETDVGCGMFDSSRCRNETTVYIGDIELSPCVVATKQVFKNCTVEICKCTICGEEDFRWHRQEDTLEITETWYR